MSSVFPITNAASSPRKLTQSVLQISEMLGMYRAELARVLHLQCGDIGRLTSAKHDLAPDTTAWKQAVLLVRFYAGLYKKMQGNGVAMCHWLRADNEELNGVPLLLIVDDNALARVIDHIEQSGAKPR